jgi:PhnB protein
MPQTFFAPHLTLKNIRAAMDYYQNAFGAKILRQWDNTDGSVHVAEMEIDGAMFHLHEETPRSKQLSPETVKATTSQIGIFVDDPHRVVQKAFEAGGTIGSAVQDYDYGYRQGVVVDPFGHQWLVQCRI